MPRQHRHRITTVVTFALLGLAAVLSFMLPKDLSIPVMMAVQPEPDQLVLEGVVRDFHRDDASLVAPGGSGDWAGSVQRWIGGDGRPRFVAGGYRVASPWLDSSGRPIAPHIAGARGGLTADSLGLRVSGTIDLKKGTIDAYNSNYGPYGLSGNYGADAIVSTNAAGAGDVQVGADGLVRGSVLIGPTGDPASVIDNSGVITGYQGPMPEAFVMPEVAVPDNPDDLEAWSSALLLVAGAHTLTGDTTPDDDNDAKALWYDDVTFSNTTITIEGDLRIRCDDRLTIEDTSVVLLPDATLTFFVGGNQDVVLKNASINVDTGDSTAVTINYLGSKKVRCENGSQVAGTVVAPSGTLDVDTSHFYGGFIGASLHVTHNTSGPDAAGVHVDRSNAIMSGQNVAIVVREKVELDKTVLDAFDSTKGPYGPTNSGNFALVTCNSFDKPEKVKVKDSTLGGDVMLGPDADIDQVVNVEGSGTITGAIGRLSEAAAVPVVAPPNMGASVGDVHYTSGEHVTLSSDLYCKRLELDNAAILTIEGDVTIRSDDKVELKHGSEIRLAPGATLTLYVQKDLKLDDDCAVNMNGSTCGDPKLVSIRRNSIGKKGKIDLKHNSRLSAWIQGAKTELKLDDACEFYGNFIGRKLKANNNSSVHVDMAYFSSCVDIADSDGSKGEPGTGGIPSSDAFDRWYADVPGTNQSLVHAITLYRDIDTWEYLNDDFHPIDGRAFGNENEQHNNFFTYVIRGEFTYTECGGQFLEFRGGDGAWLFVNGRLVMDLGGVGTTDRQYVDMDRFGLTDGVVYDIRLFFAQRQSFASQFRLRTNIDISTSNAISTVSSMYD